MVDTFTGRVVERYDMTKIPGKWVGNYRKYEIFKACKSESHRYIYHYWYFESEFEQQKEKK